jgi:hypothetical protein
VDQDSRVWENDIPAHQRGSCGCTLLDGSPASCVVLGNMAGCALVLGNVGTRLRMVLRALLQVDLGLCVDSRLILCTRCSTHTCLSGGVCLASHEFMRVHAARDHPHQPTITAAALSSSFSIPTISSLPPKVLAAFSSSATVLSSPRSSPSISARWLVIASAIAALSACVACSAVVKDALWLVRKGARCAARRDVGARRCGLGRMC